MKITADKHMIESSTSGINYNPELVLPCEDG